MNEDQLRQLLDLAATPGRDDEVRIQSALYEGHRRRRSRQRRQVTGTGTAVAVLAAAVLALVPGQQRATPLALSCASEVDSGRTASVTSGLLGVTLSVFNPTDQVMSVQAPGTNVLAVPGTSQVTLPLSFGRVSVRCGNGSAIQLDVYPAAQSDCSSAVTGWESAVQTGEPEDLTKARLGALPNGALVRAIPSPGPLQRVQVSVGRAVVAEALWHQMPDPASWQLESLSRCRPA